MTAFNTFISTVTMPLGAAFIVATLAGEEKHIGFPHQKMVEVFLLVFIPVCLGMALNYKKHTLAQKLDRPIKLFSVVALAVIIIGTLSKEWRLITDNFASVGWAVLLFNLLSLGTGYFIPRIFKIDRRQSVAISFEIGIHNAALALFVAISALGSTLMAAPATIYSISMYITAGTLCWWMSRQQKLS
jgi:BASS family bile acid:Na+ symporter